ARDLASERAEHALAIGKVRLQPLWRGGRLGVIHPERPFRLRHHDFRIGENSFVIFGPYAIDVVGMEMRDHNSVDFRGVDACGCKVVEVGSRGRGTEPSTGADIDRDELGARINDRQIEWIRHSSGWKK